MVIASLGVVNGFILSFFLMFKKQNTWSNVYFGGLLMALSIRIGKSVFVFFSDSVDRLILQIGLSACIFIGPLFYLYVKALKVEYGTSLKLDLSILIFLLLAIVTIGIIYPYRTFPDTWNHQIIYWIYGVWAVGIIFGLYESRLLLKKFINRKQDLSEKEKFILAIILAVLFITCTFQFSMFINGFTYIWGALIFTFTFYYLAIRAFINKENIVPKPKSAPIPNGPALLKELDQIMEKEKLYINPKFKLEDLARFTGMSKHDLSKLLNEEYEYGFNNYINSFRIREAKSLIQKRQDLSLEGIGYESGFNSKSSFFATFKKMVHCTPAQFKKQLN
jgi:AraC-like DNA-binding protein